MKKLLIFTIILLMLLGCMKSSKYQSRVRNIKPQTAQAYHKPIKLQIGWYPYEESKLQRTGQNEYRIVSEDSLNKKGAMPVIIMSYGDSSRALWIDMDTDEALLGKLLKHSLMTEIPVKWPYQQYFEKADCAKCHPSSIELP